jgi:Sulfotransferase family
MKSGTTLLWRLLGFHPYVYMCTPKEPCYFVEAAQLRRLQPQLWRHGYWRSQERYLQLFQSNNNEIYAGEASIYYTHLPLVTGVAERIKRFNPNARLIYIMRDPVERTISHYWHRVNHNSEDRPLPRAIAEDSQYCDVSYYAMQLKPYFDRFKSDQIKILTLEELIKNQLETIKLVFRWLGLGDSDLMPPVQFENVTPDIVRQRLSWWGALRRYSEDHKFLLDAIDRIPESARKYGARVFSRKINRLDVSIDAVVRDLQLLQRKQTDELSQLVGRDFPEWKTLNS